MKAFLVFLLGLTVAQAQTVSKFPAIAVAGSGSFGYNITAGLETVTDASNVVLDFAVQRTKLISLNQNTSITFANIPTSSTNDQPMIVKIIGDGVSSISFSPVTWETVQVPIPTSGAITLYVFLASNSAIEGYAVDFTGGNSALWAVVNGVLVPAPSQGAISVVSNLPSTGTNVVANFDTDSDLIEGETLLNVGNNGVTNLRVDAVSGYTGTGKKFFLDNGKFGYAPGTGGFIDVFSGFYGGSLPTDVPTSTAAIAYDLDPPNTMYQWDGTQWY